MLEFFEQEETRKYLVSFLKETEVIFAEVLNTIDHNSSCTLYPSLDIGFPHDLIRIAGGFPTGMLATWQCSVPVIPVDTTVNVCTSSVFKLSDNILDALSDDFFDAFFKKVTDGYYTLNFHRGNHFISFCQSSITNDSYLVLHSSASEFKKTYNGLFPVDGNWFMDDLKIYHRGNRRIRYILGKKAELFSHIAHQIDSFNITRHNFFAQTLVDDFCDILDSSHHHHYGMPTSESVLIGSFLVNPGMTVPIFSYPGDPIFLFKLTDSEKSKVSVGKTTKHLVPHGWGKTSNKKPLVNIDFKANQYSLNNVKYPINSNSSLRDHPDLTLRRFSTNEYDNDYYFNLIDDYYEGTVVDKLEQLASWNKVGFVRWDHN